MRDPLELAAPALQHRTNSEAIGPGRRETVASVSRAINSHVADRIKSLRILNGKSQKAVGEMLGLSFQQVAKYERADNRIPPDKLWVLAENFNVEVGYFFEGLDDLALNQRGGRQRRAHLDGRSDNRQLRFQLAAALEKTESTRVLSSLLGYLRAISESPEPESSE